MGKQTVYSHLVCNYQLMRCHREGSVPIVFINCDYTKSDTKLPLRKMMEGQAKGLTLQLTVPDQIRVPSKSAPC